MDREGTTLWCALQVSYSERRPGWGRPRSRWRVLRTDRRCRNRLSTPSDPGLNAPTVVRKADREERESGGGERMGRACRCSDGPRLWV